MLKIATLILFLGMTAPAAQDQTYPLDPWWPLQKGHRSEISASYALKLSLKQKGKLVASGSTACQLTVQQEILSETASETPDRRWKVSKASYIEMGKSAALPFVGKNLRLKTSKESTLTTEREDAKPFTAEEADLIARVPDVTDPNGLLSPDKALKPGDTWTPALKDTFDILAGSKMSADFAPADAKGSLTLKSVELRNGVPFATAEGSFDVPMISAGGMPLKKPILMKLTLEVVFAADGKLPDRTWKARLAGAGKVLLAGPPEEMADIEISLQKEIALKTTP